nr:hypothetical protein [Rhizobium leguminosarum]
MGWGRRRHAEWWRRKRFDQRRHWQRHAQWWRRQ